MENEWVLFVGLTVASQSQASRAPENCASGAGAPRPPGGHVSMSGRGAARHQGTRAPRQPPRGHQGIGLAQTPYIGAT